MSYSIRKRYIVCLNEEQRSKDAADRDAIVSALREPLKRGDKSLVGNPGYRKTQGERFTLAWGYEVIRS